ncbi:MAG: hypothetical protein H6680_06960 [Desulfobacteraceae bacterium]|nr:hypothetical protein [Desulfobacteraceae bacterium]
MDFITECFNNIIKKGALAPSVLFSGESGSNKTEFAKNLAKALNCLENKENNFTFCNECRNCRRINENIYPDLIIIEAEGNLIKVEQIRQLKAKLSFKPYEAKKRIVLIINASLLNPQSGNALLKMMEEPPANTHFILTAPDSASVLKTIRSRCQLFRFTRVIENQTDKSDFYSAGQILNEYDVSKKDLEMISSIFLKLFKENFQNFNMIYFAGDILSGKKTAESFFAYMLVFFRDLISVNFTDDRIYLEETKKLIAQNYKKIDNKNLHKAIEIIYSAQQRLKGNVNTKILIKSSLLKIQAAINESK